MKACEQTRPVMRPRRAITGAVAWAMTLGVAACAGSEPRAEGGPFYADRTLEVVVPYGPGGGTDTWTRLVAPYLQAELGEGAAIQVMNEPGASSVAGANAYVLRRRPDGESALVSGGSTFISDLLEEPMVRYDFERLTPILASPVGGVVFVSPDLGLTDPAGLPDIPELIYAGISVTGNDLLPILAFEVLGLNVRSILGYGSKGASRIAFEQGESTIEYQTMPAYLSNVSPLVEAGQAVPMFSFGQLDENGAVQRDPAVPDLPTIAEVYEQIHGSAPSGPAWDAYRAVLVAAVNMQKAVWLHEDAPEDAITALRDASTRLLENTEFRERAAAEVGATTFLVGEPVRALVREASQLTPETRDWLRALLLERFDVDRLGG